MSKQLAKLTTLQFMIALLLIIGVQASQSIATEGAAPQSESAACCQTVDTNQDASLSGAAGCSDGSPTDCDMDGSCHSICFNCPAAISDLSTASSLIEKSIFVYHPNVAVATPDPIDHPPKDLSSL